MLMGQLLSNTIIISLIKIKISAISPEIAPNKTSFWYGFHGAGNVP